MILPSFALSLSHKKGMEHIDNTDCKYKVLFVCLGNICRSPAAEGIMQHLVHQRGLDKLFYIDSAGTYGGHAGDLPDRRMRAVASRRGYLLEHRAQKFCASFFDRYDYIVAMDDHNYYDLTAMAYTIEDEKKIVRMADYCRHYTATHIPDPYYEGVDGFEHVLNLLEDACEGLLNDILAQGDK